MELRYWEMRYVWEYKDHYSERTIVFVELVDGWGNSLHSAFDELGLTLTHQFQHISLEIV